MRLLKRVRPYPFELVAIVSLAATVTTLRLVGLNVGFWTFLFTVRETGPMLLAALATGTVLNALLRARPSGAATAYLRETLQPSWILDMVRIWTAGELLIYSYTWLKVSIPLVNGDLWDVELARLDQVLHGGLSPSRFFIALFEETPFLSFIDVSYMLWLPVSLAMFGVFATLPGSRSRAQFVFSHVALWTLGVWLYVAMPALGPGLAFPGEWRTVTKSLPRTAAAQRVLLNNYGKVLEARSTGVLRAGFNPSYGVAAMPSLHVGVDWLLLLWCFRRARPLVSLFIGAVLVTFLGSIATGWHYAVDGYAGIAVAHVCFWLSQRVSLDLPDSAEAAPAPAG
jgi:hypothetical protein